MVTFYKIIYQDDKEIRQVDIDPKELIPMLLEIRRNYKVIHLQDNVGEEYSISEILEKEKDLLKKQLSDKSKEEIVYTMQKKLTELIKQELIYEIDFSKIMTEIRRQKDRIESIEEFRKKVIDIYLGT
ncbi:MAG: hypothetical protein ACLS95_01275 [Clostridia bacterium]